jgi:L-alanine-DL-glutamate epimerase-like enolase superfamily enzyme
MKITAIRTVVVYGPRRQVFGRTYHTGLGSWSHSEHGIVFVDTDAGITGIGEVSSAFTRRGRVLCLEVEHALAPLLVGEDPTRINYLVAKMDVGIDSSALAKAGIEMALFDITGKHLNTPVYNLLGGKFRERIPLSFSIPFGSPDEMATYASERVSQGFRTVKVKVGRDMTTDIETVRRVREAVGPDVKVRVDANMAWKTAKDAIHRINAMLQYDPELIEQPLRPNDLEGIAFIRKHVEVPIMVDESVWSPMDAVEVIRRGAADIVNVYVSESGGLLRASQTFGICEAAGIPCMIGCMPELGIGTAAQIHLGVAMRNLGPDSDACGSLYHQGDLLKTPLRIENGFSYPPEGPGLGIELDMDIIESWKAAP